MGSEGRQPLAREQDSDSRQSILGGRSMSETLQDCATNSTWSLHAHAAQVPIERVWLRDCREDYVVQGTTVYYLQGASRVWHRGLVVEELPFAVLVEWPDHPSKPAQLCDKCSRQLLRANTLNANIWDHHASDGKNWVLKAAVWDWQMHTDEWQVLLPAEELRVALGGLFAPHSRPLATLQTAKESNVKPCRARQQSQLSLGQSAPQEHQVALGAAPQQPALRLHQAATLRSPHGQDRAETGSTGPDVLGLAHLGQSAPQERHVALGAGQAAPSGATLLPVTQQPTVRVVLEPQQPIVRAQQAATASLSGGGTMAGAAAAVPTVLGPPHLGQLAPPASRRLLSAVDVASQAFWHFDRATEAAKTAAATARVAETAAKEAFRALQALPPALLHVPLAFFTQPMAAPAAPGAVHGYGSREPLTQAPVGPAFGAASPSLSEAPLPFPPPPDLAAMAAASRERRQAIPSADKLPSSSLQAAAGHAAMQMSTAEADHPGLSAAGLPSVTTTRARPFATGRSGAAQPMLPTGTSPRTPSAAMQFKTAQDTKRRAWRSTRHAHLQNATDGVDNVAAGELAADVPAAMPGYGELHPVSGPQAAAAEGAAAAESGSAEQHMQPSVEDVAVLEGLASQRDEGVDAEQPLPAVRAAPLMQADPRVQRHPCTRRVGLRKRVRVLVPPGTPTAWYATREGSVLPQRARSCYAQPLSFGVKTRAPWVAKQLESSRF